MRINTIQDLDYYLADVSTRDAALVLLQTLLDERYGWVDGIWGINSDAPFYRLGVGVEEAVARGCEDRAIPEPERPDSTVALSVDARFTRDALLASCDWTVLADVPLSEEQIEAWKAYRQALRDVPEQMDFPTTIVWPTKPE